MGPMTAELIGILGELAALLESDGEEHWRSWMLRARTYLENSDYYGIEHLLGAYGTMGSFSEFVLGQSHENGIVKWKPGYRDLNKRLCSLRDRAWYLADGIRRDRDSSHA